MADSNSFNRDQYDRFGKAYHDKRNDKSRSFYNDHLEQPLMAKLLRDRVRGKRVLELGCGSGLFTRKLVAWGGDVTGLDFSDTMLELARDTVPKAIFVKGNIARLPFPDNEFDVVASSLAFHYVKNLPAVCREASRVLKPCGILVFSMHHPFSSYAIMGRELKAARSEEVNYFKTDAYTWRMLPGMDLISYHQTFETIVGALTKSRFLVESLLEAKPAPQTRSLDPKSYDESSRYPTFVAIRAVKMCCKARF